ncbi:MAG TPA: hypothetical protein VN429_10500 [Methanospirillum sp.]|uniref:hypothetical protein n=1 Tax=Methanospirillum sp. TaxID=45200 RepID=UPI002BFA55FC|nr:hypothetical protein [Methanospirillum sp.]HWQ64835.1 hypothetical protein [Methanospirillum sp.]
MSRGCTVCAHPACNEINKLLVNGSSNRSIVAQYGLSLGAVQRHRSHIPETISEAKFVAEVAKSNDLLQTTMDLLEQAQGITNKAQAAGDLKTALEGIGKITGVLKLLMQVTLILTEKEREKEAPSVEDVRLELITKLSRITATRSPEPDNTESYP